MQAYIGAFDPADPPHTAYENAKFDLDKLPEGNEVWNKVAVISGESEPVTLGELGEDRYKGILQIDINAPTNKGTEGILNIVASLRSYFPVGKGFSYGGDTAVIESFSLTPGRVVDGYYRITAEVEFRADITRPAITP